MPGAPFFSGRGGRIGIEGFDHVLIAPGNFPAADLQGRGQFSGRLREVPGQDPEPADALVRGQAGVHRRDVVRDLLTEAGMVGQGGRNRRG